MHPIASLANLQAGTCEYGQHDEEQAKTTRVLRAVIDMEGKVLLGVYTILFCFDDYMSIMFTRRVVGRPLGVMSRLGCGHDDASATRGRSTSLKIERKVDVIKNDQLQIVCSDLNVQKPVNFALDDTYLRGATAGKYIDFPSTAASYGNTWAR
jgi:hypothetical protein